MISNNQIIVAFDMAFPNTIFSSTVKYDAKYDITKFFLSLLVLAIHSTLYPMALYPWLRIAVPLFFIISSYFFFSKIKDTDKKQQKNLLKKFVIRNLQLYLCWFIILSPITFYIRKELYLSKNFFEVLLKLLKNFLFGSLFIASWFIMALILGVLIIYFLSNLLKNNYIIFFIALTTFCFVTLASSYKSVISDTFIKTIINKYTAIFGGLVCSFPAAIFWVFVGKLFAEQKFKLKSASLLICLIILNCAALFAEWKYVISLDGSYNNDSYFFLAPLCILLFLGLQKIKPIYWEKSVFFKRTSTIIYVAHGSLLPIFKKIVSVLFNINHPLFSYILTFLGCVAIYLFLNLTIKKCENSKINKLLNMLF